MDFARPDAVEAFLHLHVYKALQETGVCGATVCVAKLGRYSFSIPNCYGFADPARGVVLDPRSSLFDLGGCAKVLAALALLQLLQEGGLPVATDINSLLPPELKVDTSRHGRVTVQHLLTHTSGLQHGGCGGGSGGVGGDRGAAAGGGTAAEGGSSAAAAAVSVMSPRSAGERHQQQQQQQQPSSGPSGCSPGRERVKTVVMSYMLAQPVHAAKPPGTYRPHDLDYMLIGAIIEHLTGESYDTYVKDVLLEPLGVRLPPQPRDPRVGYENGASAANATTPGDVANGSLPNDRRPSVFVQVGQRVLEQARVRALEQGRPVGLSDCSGNTGGAGPEALSSLQENPARPGTTPDKKVLARYDPPPLTPVGGLVLTTEDISRMLPLLLHNSAAAGGDPDPGAGGSGGLGRSLLSSLYEIRLYDFIKDVGVAYGGLVSLGLGRCGDRVVSCESPPPPPSTRELALTAQAAAQAARAAALEEAARAGQGEEEGEGEQGADGKEAPLASAPRLQSDQPAPLLRVGAPGEVADRSADEPGLPEQDTQQQQKQRQQQQRGEEQQGLSPATCGDSDGGGDSGGAVPPDLPSLVHPCLLLVAPEGGLALVVCCNTAGPQGAAFCRSVATKLLERYRPAELPRSVVRSWLAAVPPPRQDAIVHLAVFPPACCLNPTTYFDGWQLSMPDFIKLHCLQAPGHGTRRHEPCEQQRLPKLVPPAAAALLAGVPADSPLALFGHGLGALWAFEVARRMEGLYQRQLLHLFVCACAAPTCFPPARGGDGGGAGEGGGGGGSVRRFQTWWIPDQQRQQLLLQKQYQEQMLQQFQTLPRQPSLPADRPGTSARGPPPLPGSPASESSKGKGDLPELYELNDELFITSCRNHPRFPRQLRHDIKAILDHLPLLRADIETELRYNFLPPTPSLCPSVAAVLASVQNKADEETRISQGLLSCPITVLIPERETALGPDVTAGWEQVTTGPVRFLSVGGDYHCLEERSTRGQVVAAITGALGRQMSVHTPWLGKLRPERAGGSHHRDLPSSISPSAPYQTHWITVFCPVPFPAQPSVAANVHSGHVVVVVVVVDLPSAAAAAACG
ncbi:hypothetical protein VOLCADRAFT_97155 [Volvox carteri f. nagariensis]|uniref:Beta-lactamase-related domain-containing protein n=1 Tax=Volvox carteri f. nagariensis TaxID=3068 RepID=D8UC09_VOLCA|nr:uncharacterized protein VOLCADRAFT_97155 [Volvox carteri f. nagariensis]EFJ42713.1 hypothetical protein VOLCADRAFT_97155 [Volvox carteri f. nagariensis]|eukprot:XP_002956174.1 hypothetical protein VOLCADRAFT_97155 [Volvox carteri f. nagariensis]